MESDDSRHNQTVKNAAVEVGNDADADADNDVSDYVSSMNISIKRGTAYLRKTNVRTKAYAELYYDLTNFWNYIYYGLHFGLIGIGIIQTIVILVLQIVNKPIEITYVGAVAGAFTTAGTAIMMVLNPGSKSRTSEDAGDDYSSVSEDLELFDPQTCSINDINNLVKMVSKRIKKIKKKYQEPDRHKLKKKKEEIVALIRTAKESLLYLDAEYVDSSSVHSGTNGINGTNGTNGSISDYKVNSTDEDLSEPIPRSINMSTKNLELLQPNNVISKDIPSSDSTVLTATNTMSATAINNSSNNSNSGGSSRSARRRLSSRRPTLMDLEDGRL